MSSTAVVFDSAGTLLHMYRAAKNLINGTICYDIVTTNLASTNPNYGIVILHIDPDTLLQINENYLIHQFLDEYNIAIDIGCSSLPVSVEEARLIINFDSRAIVSDLHEVLQAVLGRCDNRRYMGVGVMIDTAHNCIPYTLSTGGSLFPGVADVVKQLEDMGVDVYIASGDKQEDVELIARSIGVKKEHTFGLSTPQCKGEIVAGLKRSYDKVVMVGDAINDIMAFKQADFAVLTVQQRNIRPEKLSNEADVIIDHISRIVPIVGDLI
ncbi:MAG: HAD family hydrolase [Nitrospirae bacterium]|nr:HAD family hydrolase [Nitrospirota bacterium]